MAKRIRRKEFTKRDIAASISMGSDVYSGKFDVLKNRSRNYLERIYTKVYGRKFSQRRRKHGKGRTRR